MTTHEVKQAISYWTKWANETKQYDIALFKIWIKFEQFISKLFELYATGQSSETGYIPNRRLEFQNEEHLNLFLRGKSKPYIEYWGVIEHLSKHIFVENPFDILVSDATITSSFKEIRAIRNYIAHESGEAKRKLVKSCFSGNDKHFREPNDYLTSRNKTTKNSYYTDYVETISNTVEILIDPRPTTTEG
ncbi:MAG: hypothetical protein J6V99_07825 [Neisseriaceae bacterium]|nr:hypothetical protein [Neisseriaceae bacterium]